MMTIREYARPATLEEAWQLNQKKPNRVLGGMLWLKQQEAAARKAKRAALRRARLAACRSFSAARMLACSRFNASTRALTGRVAPVAKKSR